MALGTKSLNYKNITHIDINKIELIDNMGDIFIFVPLGQFHCGHVYW